MKKFFEILDLGIAQINKTVAVIGIAAGVLLAFINVVMRYVFNEGFTWAGEMTNYFFIWSAFFAAAYGFKKGIHISVTLLIEKFPPSIAKICIVLSSILTTAFLIFISIYSINYILVLHEIDYRSIDLNIAVWIPMLVIPLAFLMASYRAGEKLYEVVKTPCETVAKKLADEMIEDAASYQIQDGQK